MHLTSTHNGTLGKLNHIQKLLFRVSAWVALDIIATDLVSSMRLETGPRFANICYAKSLAKHDLYGWSELKTILVEKIKVKDNVAQSYKG